MTHAAVSGTSSEYIKDLSTPTREISGRSYLRSAVFGNFCGQTFKSEFGRLALSVAGPVEWNAIAGERSEHQGQGQLQKGYQDAPVQAGLQLLVKTNDWNKYCGQF